MTSSSSLDDIQLPNGSSSINNNVKKKNNNNNSLNNNEDEMNMSVNMTHVEVSWKDSSSPVLSHHRVTPILSRANTMAGSSMGPFGTPPTASPAFSTASTSSVGSSPIPNTISPNITGTTTVLTRGNVERVIATSDTVTTNLPKPEQWLGSVTNSVPSSSASSTPPSSSVPSSVPSSTTSAPPITQTPRRAPPLHARAHSLGSAALGVTTGRPSDPFDAEWAEIAARNLRQSNATNPFIVPNATQAFHVEL